MASLALHYNKEINVPTTDDSDISFSYNLMAGVTYSPNSNIDLTLGDKWLIVADATIEADLRHAEAEGDSKMHEVLGGLRYKF